MKTSILHVIALAGALAFSSVPSVWADSAIQNNSPGAQGTEGTNPTHQDQEGVSGSTSNHSTDTTSASGSSDEKKAHHTTCDSSSH